MPHGGKKDNKKKHAPDSNAAAINLVPISAGSKPAADKGPFVNNFAKDEARFLLLPHLSLKQLAILARTSKANRALFQPFLDKAKAVFELQNDIVRGELDKVLAKVRENLNLLFEEAESVTDESGQTFYGATGLQLMYFLCDGDMLTQIRPLIPEGKIELAKKQYTDIQGGGNDLVKMDRDPTKIPFADILRFQERRPYVTGEYPLLENRNGLVFYNNQLYYVSQDSQDAVLLYHTAEETAKLADLKASFSKMEMNSGRRSNREEREIIKKTTRLPLNCSGVHYARDGQHYCGTHDDFALKTAYRKYLRLWAEMRHDELVACWLHDIGGAQRRNIWLLQRFCEEGRPFFPLPNSNTSPFKRQLIIRNFWPQGKYNSEGVLESVVPMKETQGLKVSYAIYKADGCARGAAEGGAWEWAIRDLPAVHWYVQIGKAAVVEFIPALEAQARSVAAPMR